METISLKVDDSMLKRIDKASKEHDFGTRTEFIRAAMREKLEKLKREELVSEFLKLRGRGRSKSAISDKEMKSRASKELLDILEKRFS